MAVPVDVTVLRSGLPSSIPGRSVDIGEGGVAAVLAAELQTGEWVAVEFQLPTSGYSLQTKAVVRGITTNCDAALNSRFQRDQRYMIRHWAGTVEPEQSSLESPIIGPAIPGPAIPGPAIQKVPVAVAVSGVSSQAYRKWESAATRSGCCWQPWRC